MSFSDQHIIITGGSSGIGKETAKCFAREGANVTIIARDKAKLSVAKKEIEESRRSDRQMILALSADVGDPRALDEAMCETVNTLGPPEILITSAGIAVPDYFPDLSLEVFDDTMTINFLGTVYAIRSAVRWMEENGRGHLVLMSSGSGLIGVVGNCAYSPSKFAVRGLAESLRSELKPKGIYVSVVYPPDTLTPQYEEENKTKPAETKAITETASVWTAENVARAIVKGIKRKSFAITPGFAMTMLNRFNGLLNPMLNFYFDRIVAREARRNE